MSRLMLLPLHSVDSPTSVASAMPSSGTLFKIKQSNIRQNIPQK
jgi:hypothetical protein